MREYCIDLEIAKELNENNFPRNVSYRYEIDYHNNSSICSNHVPINDHITETYPAPITDEILKELPKEYKQYGFAIHLIRHNKSELDHYSAGYYDYHEPYFIGSDKKLSNALAKIWLNLKKEGYIK